MMMLETANTTHFSLEVQGLNTRATLQVVSFEGLEAISSDYAVEITLICNQLRFDITQLLSLPAFLSFDSDSSSGLHGIIQQVRRCAVGIDYALFKIVLTSELSYLKHRMNQKVFRKQSIPEIISSVLSDYGLAEGLNFEFTLKEIYPPREYTTQYHQTDYELINHLAQSEGIFYYFLHSQDGHKLIFADANPFFTVRNETIIYKSDTGFTADKRVAKRFDITLKSTTTETTFRNYNFITMKVPEGNAHGRHSSKLQNATEVTLEAYDYPSRHNNINTAKRLAKIEIERLKSSQVLAQMDSDVVGLHTGLFINVTQHPLKDVDDLWLIQEIRHAGKQPCVLEALGDQHTANNTSHSSQLLKYFEYPIDSALELSLRDFSQGYRNVAILSPKDIPYRPLKLHPKPKILGTQTAIVTGPEGEEIYCDAYGRVKIQCHWDRLGNYDDLSSDWVRVCSNWAHNGYGAIAIPRVGMEVLVAYEEGDPDFPMIVGALHNGINKVPYKLPAHKTKTVFKTSSSKGGVGSNEFRVEDKAHNEQIFLQAQKDFDQLTKHNHTIQVNNNSHLHVKHEHSQTIVKNRYTKNQGEEHHLTNHDRKTQIIMNDHKQVLMAEHTKVGTIQTIQAGQEIHLKAGGHIVIDGGLSLTLKAGGQHIKLDPMGIWMTQPQWTGGIAMEGSPSLPCSPLTKEKIVPSTDTPVVTVGTAKQAKEPTEIIKKIKFIVRPLPNLPGYRQEPYTLFVDGILKQKGLTDNDGAIITNHIPNAKEYEIKLINGHLFTIHMTDTSDQITDSDLAGAKGYRCFEHNEQNEGILETKEDYRLKAQDPNWCKA